MTSSDQLLLDSATLPTIVGMVRLVKARIPEKYWWCLPIVAIALGIAYALTYRPGCQLTMECVLQGFQTGIMATGLHSSFKNAIQSGGSA